MVIRIARRTGRTLALLLALASPLLGPAARAEQTKAPAPADKSSVKVETVARGLVHPWGLQFLPAAEPYGGRLLVTEREGRLRIVARDGTLSPPVAGVPPVAEVPPVAGGVKHPALLDAGKGDGLVGVGQAALMILR